MTTIKFFRFMRFSDRTLGTVILACILSTTVFLGNAHCTEDDDILMLVLPALIKANQPEPISKITMDKIGDRLIVSSSKAPTWKVEFAVGSGAPGGGTAIAVYIPSNDSRSIVEPQPYQICCSGLGLDTLEWRWRPWGGSAGTRGSAGHSSSVTQFNIIENTSQKLVFRLRGSWQGISEFERTTTVTPDGFTTFVSATYAGTPGKDSMWWVISLFRPDKMDADHVMVSDNDSSPAPLNYTPNAYRPLPSDISLPYTFHFPLTTKGIDPIKLKVVHLAEGVGNPYGYELFDVGGSKGNYNLVYPRWRGSFENITYHFEWNWRFTPE